MMKRREFITLLGGATASWPLATRAQQAAMPVIGILAAPAPAPIQAQIVAFREGLKELGYVEGQNVTIEHRWAAGQYDQLPAMAADLVARRATVIVALAPPAATAAKAATAVIPVVFVIGADPVKLGLVTSLNRPSGNITGVSFLINALGGKRLQLIRELIPGTGAVGLLVNPKERSTDLDRQDVEQMAGRAGQKIHVVHAGSESEFEPAFVQLVDHSVDALIISPDAFFTSHRDQLVALAARYRIPTIYHLREAATAGGLISYGTSITNAHRLAGDYTGRLLKGAKPDELPVQQSTKFELVLNLKTAKALGLTVPDRLLALADEVIE